MSFPCFIYFLFSVFYFLFSISYSLFPISYFLFSISHSYFLFPISYSLFSVLIPPHFLNPIFYCHLELHSAEAVTEGLGSAKPQQPRTTCRYHCIMMHIPRAGARHRPSAPNSHFLRSRHHFLPSLLPFFHAPPPSTPLSPPSPPPLAPPYPAIPIFLK